jgi:hypothetical protein
VEKAFDHSPDGKSLINHSRFLKKKEIQDHATLPSFFGNPGHVPVRAQFGAIKS